MEFQNIKEVSNPVHCYGNKIVIQTLAEISIFHI